MRRLVFNIQYPTAPAAPIDNVPTRMVITLIAPHPRFAPLWSAAELLVWAPIYGPFFHGRTPDARRGTCVFDPRGPFILKAPP